MVRFIMIKQQQRYKKCMEIYIPIWLDLLYDFLTSLKNAENNLHSNMVRFIIFFKSPQSVIVDIFTFQYG